MDANEPIVVEVVYALPERQTLIALEVPAGATVRDAIERSRIAARHPEIDPTRCKVGIHGRVCTLQAPLRAGDRVEIYRPLLADIKEVRRQRATAGKPLRAKVRSK